MAWTYEMYAAADNGDEFKNRVRQNFGFDGRDAYFLLHDGAIRIVHWEGQAPDDYGAGTLEEIAAAHCAALNAEEQASVAAVGEEETE